MPNAKAYTFRQLTRDDLALMKHLLRTFGEAFDDIDAYQSAVPSDAYLSQLLAKPHFIAIAALNGEDVVGGIAAYQLDKFERERREIYVYDLAVVERHRRKGVATGMLNCLKRIAAERKAYVIFIQADQGDAPAIALYESFGTKEEVLHFDIDPLAADPARVPP
jgi:aminoglycoside 3-N-acetyltransferase I